jgi:hypothetical protein
MRTSLRPQTLSPIQGFVSLPARKYSLLYPGWAADGIGSDHYPSVASLIDSQPPDEEYTMSDPERITIVPRGSEGPEGSGGPESGDRRTGTGRALLWLLLVVSAVGNSVTSFGGVSTGVHLGLGALSALSIVALLVSYLRARR